MKVFLFACLFSFIYLIQCSGSLRNKIAVASEGDSTDDRIPKEKVIPGFNKLLEFMTAFNLKLKYELGEQVALAIQEMGSLYQDVGYEELMSNPEDIAHNALNIYDMYVSDGWARIAQSLGSKSHNCDLKNQLFNFAIGNENLNLIRDLIGNDALFISYDMYRIAIRKASLSQTDASESIVDEIARAAGSELGIIPNFSNKLYLGLANIQIYDYITAHEFSMLERALKEGLNPNTRIANVGNLLGISVMVKCFRCTKLLIEFGASIGVPLEYSELIKTPEINVDIIPQGWSPLMVAVAHGDQRIVKLLIDAGAQVSYVPPGKEDERFHARAVARMIKSKKPNLGLRKLILSILKPNPTEMRILMNQTEDKTFIEAVSTHNHSLMDVFLLLRPTISDFPKALQINSAAVPLFISNLLSSEEIIFSEQ